jgi:hypothetical protein
MAFSRTTGALVGTNESSLQSINSGTTFNGAEVDILGDNASIGEAWLYAIVTAASVSSIDVSINQRRLTAQAYKKLSPDINIPTINGTQRVPLGKWPVPRLLQVDVLNNAGGTVTVFIGYELEKFTP